MDGLHPRRLALAPALVIACSMLLAACAGSSPGLPTAQPAAASGVPSGSSSPVASGSATTGSSDPAVAWPAFAACLRAHGLDVADPEVDDQGEPHFASGVDLSTVVTPAIQQACSPTIAAVTANKAAKSYAFDSLVAHAACLRQHGLPNYPDPDPNAIEQRLAPGYSKADPTVNAAIIACAPLLIQATATPSPSQ
jgi:hypothetical protein